MTARLALLTTLAATTLLALPLVAAATPNSVTVRAPVIAHCFDLGPGNVPPVCVNTHPAWCTLDMVTGYFTCHVEDVLDPFPVTSPAFPPLLP